MIPTRIDWAEFAPDLSDYSQYTDAIKNVVPLADSYGPLPSFAQVGSATISAAPKGAYSARKSDGTSTTIAGTTADLFQYSDTGLNFDQISDTGDYTGAGDWDFHQFGTDLIATNGVVTQRFQLDSGTVFETLSNAPVAKYVATMGDFLLLGNLSTDEKAVAWSGINNITFWTYGERGSDTQSFPDGGAVQGFFEFDKGAAVFLEDKIYALDFVGGQTVFNSRVLHENIGCFAPYSIVPVRNTVFWYAQGGFYEGLEAAPIGAERVNRYILDNADSETLDQMRGFVDPKRKMVWWAYQDSNAMFVWLGFNWVTRKWTYAEPNIEFLLPVVVSSGATFDTWDNFASTFDGLPGTFDSAIYASSNLAEIGGFNNSGAFGFINGPALEATLETGDIEADEGHFSFIQSSRLVSDASLSDASGRIGTRQFHGQAIDWSDSVIPDTSTGRLWFSGRRGMTHRIRNVIASTADWNNTRGCEVYMRMAGRG